MLEVIPDVRGHSWCGVGTSRESLHWIKSLSYWSDDRIWSNPILEEEEFLRNCKDSSLRKWWQEISANLSCSWCSDDAVTTQWWRCDDAVTTQWRRSDDAVMMQWWCSDEAVMMQWWCSDDAVMTQWWRSERFSMNVLMEKLSGREHKLVWTSEDVSVLNYSRSVNSPNCWRVLIIIQIIPERRWNVQGLPSFILTNIILYHSITSVSLNRSFYFQSPDLLLIKLIRWKMLRQQFLTWTIYFLANCLET